MTKSNQSTTLDDICNYLLDNGLADGLIFLSEQLMNRTMTLEREAHLQALSHQRTEKRTGYANGFKPKTYYTTLGKLNLQIPQVRNVEEPFYPSIIEKGSRVDKALALAVAEMYVQGISTRKIKKVLFEMWGMEVSSSQISRLSAELDDALTEWRNRPLPPISHLILDATYIKIRVNSSVRNCAMLIAVGIERDSGKRIVLGLSCELSEAEIHWRTFLSSLKERGIGLPSGITTDAHEGLKSALTTVFPGVPWQRCQFHLQQNAQKYVTKQSLKLLFASQIKEVFDAKNKAVALHLLHELSDHYQKTMPNLSDWLLDNIPEGLTFQNFAPDIRKKIRTSNMMENINKQIKRRTRVANLFPNPNSAVRLVSAILQEYSDEWESGRPYIDPISYSNSLINL